MMMVTGWCHSILHCSADQEDASVIEICEHIIINDSLMQCGTRILQCTASNETSCLRTYAMKSAIITPQGYSCEADGTQLHCMIQQPEPGGNGCRVTMFPTRTTLLLVSSLVQLHQDCARLSSRIIPHKNKTIVASFPCTAAPRFSNTVKHGSFRIRTRLLLLPSLVQLHQVSATLSSRSSRSSPSSS